MQKQKTVSSDSTDTLINLLNVNNEPYEQNCVDTRLQTGFSLCVTQHLSRHPNTLPLSHPAFDSWESRVGMSHEPAFDPNVSSSWSVSDVKSSASALFGCFSVLKINT